MDGDGLTGRQDEVVYPLNDEHRRIMALSTIEKGSALTHAILTQRLGTVFWIMHRKEDFACYNTSQRTKRIGARRKEVPSTSG
jgi:hypothetical protein